MAPARRDRDDPLAFLADRDLFGDLVDDERFTDAYRARCAPCTSAAPARRSRSSPVRHDPPPCSVS